MFDIAQLIAFSIAAYILIVVPGPAVLYVIARNIEQGRAAGFASVLGVAIGALCHTLLAAVGLSAILAASAVAFSVVKYAGAAYLIYLGVKTLRERTDDEATTIVVEQKSIGRITRDGIIVNLLNPKAALFFLAFLPQFADPARGSLAAQMLILGVIFIIIAVLSDGMYVLLADGFGRILKQSTTFQRRQKLFSGTTYIALGLAAAFGGNGNSK